MKKLKSLIVKTAFLFCLVATSCSAKTSLQTKYGDDAYYFMALDAQKNGNINNACRLLKKSIKKSSALIQRRSFEEYVKISSPKESLLVSQNLYNKYKDDEALLEYVKALYKAKEYTKIISLTSKIDFSSTPKEIIYYRIKSLKENKSKYFTDEFIKWCRFQNFSKEHYELAKNIEDNELFVQMKMHVYTKEYDKAFEDAKSFVKELYEKNDADFLNSVIVSDIGKAFLYSSQNVRSSVSFLEDIKKIVLDDSRFYLSFYEARLYAKNKDYTSLAIQKFLEAISFTDDKKLSDNALWYLFDTVCKNEPSLLIEILSNYSSKINDPNYFDDFFDSLSVNLLSNQCWNEYFKIAMLIEKTASEEAQAKFAYVSARLIELGCVIPLGYDREEVLSLLYKRALNSSTDIYYKLIASSKLNLSEEEIYKILCSPSRQVLFTQDTALEKLLTGYADFGFPEKIFPEWQKNQYGISMECAKFLAEFLNKCGTKDNDFYAQSLRIAAKKLNYCEKAVDKELLMLVYPQNFHEDVYSASSRFSLPEELLYALIRSESFFNPKVLSHAGAIGLTQLMKPTANDIARKLKMSDYDLTDSKTNILFGAYYLEELRRRLDGSSILALFAYNGGISRVRKWVKSVNAEFNTKDLPRDIFLEAIPFSETREYGRKVSSAAAIYGLLYYEKSVKNTLAEVLN